MDNSNSLSPFGSGFIPLQLDSITQIICTTQRNEKIIKKEHKKLKSFFKQNPDAFYYHLQLSKEKLEACDSLTEFDEKSLEQINRMLNMKEDIESYFIFENEFLLNNYQVIFSQLSKIDLEVLRSSSLVELIFYSLDNRDRTSVPIGDFFNDGVLNTGSRIQIEVVKFDHRAFLSLYQSLLN